MSGRTESAEARANRLDILSRLADDLAHEVKNPLHSLVINSELIRRRIVRGETDAALERCDVLSEEVHRLHELIDGILRLFRPSRDNAGITEVDLALGEIAPLLERQARLVGVEWRYDAPPPGTRAVIGSAALVQAVLNLVVNALDAMGGDGGRIEMDVSVADSEVAIRVRDTAPVPAGDAAAAADAPATREGLAITRSLAEDAGGRLVAEPPNDGGGTRFVLVLPRLRSA